MGRATVVERRPGVITEPVGRRSLVAHPDGDRVLTLSRTGSVVWGAIDGRRDVDALARHLVEHTAGGTVERAATDVASFLAELVAADLARWVDPDEPAPQAP